MPLSGSCKPVKLLACALLLSAIAGNRSALAQDHDVAGGYQAKRLTLSTEFLVLSLEVPELRRKDASIDPDNYRSVFSEQPQSLDYFDSYEDWRVAGSIVSLVGVASMVAGLVLWQPWDDDSGSTTIGVTFLVSGVVLGMEGAFFQRVSRSYLLDAVNSYNAALLDSLSSPTGVAER